MRVNVYAEEMTSRIDIISKEINDHKFTGLRFYLELPVTNEDGTQHKGPFMHHPDDDDSSAVTFWGKRDLREMLQKAMVELDKHYGEINRGIETIKNTLVAIMNMTDDKNVHEMLEFCISSLDPLNTDDDFQKKDYVCLVNRLCHSVLGDKLITEKNKLHHQIADQLITHSFVKGE